MEMLQGASLLSRPAEEFGNDALLEEMWATRALEHAEVHFNLITSVPPSQLRLTPYDDQIYATFRQDFPQLQVAKLDDNQLKSATEKLKWRQFAEKFNKMEDYSYGSLMRADASKEFSADNSIFVFRVQFLAIEIARNREGHNDAVYRQYRPAAKSPKEEENKST
ncbi:uncharacterized protein Dwil_GK13050 [Drosophila willistoni]|uniref:Polysaccharide biosynthesis domain-containing protein n=1 Tax=Drosophila willistoni TaxID=7260 RepID=B4N3N0_DROWI|nr:protein PBDC1 [Drosophila willistoni]EDW79235.1 uncharacterized protein Dwil_GK13050 [Drosophila willistoni]